jgi:hypothetical protein
MDGSFAWHVIDSIVGRVGFVPIASRLVFSAGPMHGLGGGAFIIQRVVVTST